MNTQPTRAKWLGPIVLNFFVMGIVDFVGVSTNYIKKDFVLSDFSASVIPMMVFLWFAVFSIPTGLLMNKIGKRKTVLLGIAVSMLALIIPPLFYNFTLVVLAFALLGIGNTILQVSLNPLVASIVTQGRLASTLTFGQFVKAISSFLGPILASVMAKQFGDWKLAFWVFALVSAISFLWLYFTPIAEQQKQTERKNPSFQSVLKLFKLSFIFKLFLGILFIVGVDVGMNTYTPALLEQRLFLSTHDATLGSSLYFAARTIGAFFGAFILLRCLPSLFLKISMLVAIVGFVILMFAESQMLLFASIVLVGISCANVFSIIFTWALQYDTKQANEISSLMIIGVAGGSIITPIAGLMSDIWGLWASFAVFLLCTVYILFLAFKFQK